jgi:hypothetical protein
MLRQLRVPLFGKAGSLAYARLSSGRGCLKSGDKAYPRHVISRHRAVAGISLIAAIAFASPAARADADGPDFLRVVGIRAGAMLNIRAEPDASSRKAGELPANADGIRNLGCQGGMNIVEWEKATPTEREAARHKRWCKIEYRGVTGWAAGWFLGEGSPPKGTTR